MTSDQFVILLLDLALVFVAVRLLGSVFRRMHQPPVIGEIIAGILMGPTLFDGAIGNVLFPHEVRPYLTGLADLGVVLFMFTVGFEFDHRLLKGMRRAVVTVSVGSVIPTFGLGVLLAWYLASGEPADNRTASVLFLGVAMSVTALPVLARILHDRNVIRTRVSALALSSAAITDAFAWLALAALTMLASDHDKWRLLLFPAFLALLLALRPLARRLMIRAEQSSASAQSVLILVVSGLLLSAACTEWIGLHFVLGAFLFGFLLPKDELPQVRTEVEDFVHKMGTSLLLPIFFVTAGLKVDLSQIGLNGLGHFVLITLVALGGKFGGVFLGAWAGGLRKSESTTLSVLMNVRGLTELVMLATGLSLGLLDQHLYSLMVLMAVLTTALSGPLLRLAPPLSPTAPEAAGFMSTLENPLRDQMSPSVSRGSESPTTLAGDSTDR
ncbi:cation:proton antiporter [Saccharopolyspora shandongensis]|uniref:cation:proton antiporter n=1 Tax=Saccharopolyspora shandongensis TaxID=418495 RepID=UPI0033C80168